MDIGELPALSAVICDIYDAAIDPAKWAIALQRACEFVGGFQANVFWQDGATESAAALHTFNADPHYTRIYQETYAPLNPVFPAAIFMPVGEVYSAREIVPQSEMEQTRFYREWLAPQGMTDSLAVLLEREAFRAAFLTVQWIDGAAGSEPRDRLALLVPHFQRAVAIGSLFSKQKAETTALTDTLNRVDAGVFLVAGKGRIVFASDSGRRMIEDGILLRAGSNELRAVDPTADRALQDGFRIIESQDAPIGVRGITVALSDAPNRRWIANVLPLLDGARRQTGETYHASAAVFVRNSTFADPNPLENLAKRYRLTASEIRVAETVLRMTGNDAIATALGISRATVKTHLNRIFRKTAAKNQTELIKLIAGL